MPRKGSPWQGVGVVTVKELADHLSSARMFVLQLLVVLTAGVSLYMAIDQLRQTTAEDPFVLLKLFTTGRTPLPSFAGIIGFLVPLISIGLGFDAINGEHSRRTLSRVLAQPIYRDALLAGKFIAGLASLTVALASMWLLVVGFGVLLLGVPPSGEEMIRAFAFLFVTLVYAGVWLALAMLLSVLFRSAATAALVALGVWLFSSLIWPILASAFAQLISPPDIRFLMLGLPSIPTLEWQQTLSRISPSALYDEATLAILNPTVRGLDPTTRAIGVYFKVPGMEDGNPLALGESLYVAWPPGVSLIAAVILLFALTYVIFQRQEVRA